MAEKSIIIIGAGIAGLSAGCYAQMNGYKAHIFELHTLPGGLCTSWDRKGYTFDGCIDWLVGSGEKSNFRRIWNELGALDGKKIVNHDEFMRVIAKDGKTLVLYTDPDRLEKHMLELAPQDAVPIKEFTGVIRKMSHISLPTGKPTNLSEMLQFVIALPGFLSFTALLRKYSKVTMQDFSRSFQDPFLRKAFEDLFGVLDFPMIGAAMSLGWMSAHDAGYPVGGSLKFAQSIEKRFCSLGGEITYKARVAKILVENNQAVGIRLADGREYRADVVISAADGHATLFEMLDGKYLTDEIRGYYDTLPIFQPIIQISLGVARDFSDQPRMASYYLDKPISIAGEERQSLQVKHYCYDPTLAPAGKSIVEVICSSNYGYWKKLAEDPERYEAEKKDIAIQVMNQIEKHYPGFTGQVEVVDVATPLTYERYTGNWQGSMEGWMMTTKTLDWMMTGKQMSKTLPGLANFYQIGQWVEPGGGLPPAATSARGVLQMICKKDGKVFKTTLSPASK
ncbi:MAG TPA: NAD(P)/FAD-dependent oxidoreductase [Anaerolineaceae bacterium]|nr:NAD(P)/FAD-dependent oxidoreductase [Anaerolineaceae bacterium]